MTLKLKKWNYQIKIQFQILFALYEKNLKFSAYEIDAAIGEQYSSWFLELNPKAEVPVLQNGTLVIPESGAILNYLEENFKTGRLLQYILN